MVRCPAVTAHAFFAFFLTAAFFVGFFAGFLGLALPEPSPGRVMAMRFSPTELIVNVAYSEPLSRRPS